MRCRRRCGRGLLIGLGLVWASAAGAIEPGFHPEVRVSAPTRLDWEFAAASFGNDAARLPPDYDYRRQRYQLYVPRGYKVSQRWPLVIFISPGDDPLGWRAWQKVCEERGLFFCAAYGAGNHCPPGLRVRIVLDMLDDLRRHLSIDPDQTYLAGFSGGGRLACSIAFALPEYFGGVIAIGGTNPLHSLPYLRHRVEDRLSVALVAGENDFNRRECQDYLFPLWQEVGLRARLWVVAGLGHALPPGEVLAEVHTWLADDLKRRRDDARLRPGLSAAPDEVPTALQQATRQVEAAQAELKKSPPQVWRAVALAQGVEARWGKTSAAGRAILLQEGVEADPKQRALLAAQRGAEKRRWLAAQARALERFGQRRRSLETWQQLADEFPRTAEGDQAAKEARRLAAAIAAAPRQPYLGVAFVSETTTVARVLEGGPAEKGGMKPGDVILRLGTVKVVSLAEILRALERHRPGERITLDIQRGSKPLTLTVEVGGRLPPGDE